MNKIIGLLTAWNEENLIKATLHQFDKICDEIIIAIDPHSKTMEKYKDNTRSIVEEFAKNNNKIKIVGSALCGNCSITLANTLTNMLYSSRYNKENNWICALDCDEFFCDKDLHEIKNLITEGKLNNFGRIKTKVHYYYINDRHFLKTHDSSFFRITNGHNKFAPTRHYYSKDRSVYEMNVIDHHYALLKNPNAKKDYWKTAYKKGDGKSFTINEDKVRWMDKIYLNYELSNQEKWVNENEKIFGKRTPFWITDYITDNGVLFHDTSDSPESFKLSNLYGVVDTRKLYENARNNKS